ncbi:MAG: hypothetical protein FD174_2689 [Geobacteraceae bacterium]|nr:MAG: hypothetical protein FD174_2689 [Geobacteraceae bacterium]
MDKLRILKEFEKLTAGDALDTDEFRLYLLLLAHCGDTRNGEIAYRTVRRALGEGFTPVRLKQACHRLSLYNLVEIVFTRQDTTAGDDFTLIYRIYSVGEQRE